MNRLNNYHQVNCDSCAVCINLINHSYPYNPNCKLNNHGPNTMIDYYGICNKFKKNHFWDKLND
jgi:hypothetical protein